MTQHDAPLQTQPQDPSLAQPGRRGLLGLWDRYIGRGIAEEELSSQSAQAELPPERLDLKIITVLSVSALMLTLLEYYSKRHYFVSNILTPGENPFSVDNQLNQLLYWAGWCVSAYFVLPAFIVKVFFRERLRDYGLTWRGFGSHAWLYGLMFVIMVPLVFIVSLDESFLMTYPFYRSAAVDPRGYWLWMLAYAAQFFSLEFFFRGFLIHGLKRRMGVYSVMVMVVPYCMIHFGKPMLETVGAIIAGVVLGFLSLRTNSIMLGVLIHISVALTMDLVSLWRQGVLEKVLF